MKSTHYRLNNGTTIVKTGKVYSVICGSPSIVLDVDRFEIRFLLTVAKKKGLKVEFTSRWEGSNHTRFNR
jgi:hypothetical protein